MGVTEQTKQTRSKSAEQPGEIEKKGKDVVAEPEDRVDKVRDILFGAQREEYDRRFNRLEELLVKSITDLNNDTTKKLSALRDEYDKRFSRLEELLVKNISDLSNDTAKKLSTLRDEYDKRLTALEELMIKNISDLNKDITRKFNDVKNDIESLGDNKVDKSAMTKLLERTLKLNNELNAVKKENDVKG